MLSLRTRHDQRPTTNDTTHIRDFEISELEVFVLKEEKEEWANRLRSPENAGRTANADSLRPRA
jgi:hypothetical protein